MTIHGKPIHTLRPTEVPVSRALEIVLARVSMDRKVADVLRKTLDAVREAEWQQTLAEAQAEGVAPPQPDCVAPFDRVLQLVRLEAGRLETISRMWEESARQQADHGEVERMMSASGRTAARSRQCDYLAIALEVLRTDGFEAAKASLQGGGA